MITLKQAIAEMIRKGDFYGDGTDFDTYRWSEADIDQVEQAIGLSFPHQLREFYLTYGSVSAQYNNCFLITFDDGSTYVNEIQVVGSSIEQVISDDKGFRRSTPPPPRVEAPVIFFGTAEGGHASLLMNGNNPEDNAVYCWGLAYDPWGEGDNTLGIGKCADSLAEFLFNLQPYENW